MDNFLSSVYLRNKIINFIKKDNEIGRVLSNKKYWEEWMIFYISKYYIKGTNMIDLGGNIGTTSLLMKEVLSDENKIFVFEPIYFEILLKNIKENNYCNDIILYPYAVGNNERVFFHEKIDFNESLNFGAVSLINNKTIFNENEKLTIISKTVDSFAFDNVSLIKIDVERMEIEVLEGCINLIKKCKPTILVETYDYDLFVSSSIFKELTNIGYSINEIPEGYKDYIMINKN